MACNAFILTIIFGLSKSYRKTLFKDPIMGIIEAKINNFIFVLNFFLNIA